jgi:hypothetical protein
MGVDRHPQYGQMGVTSQPQVFFFFFELGAFLEFHQKIWGNFGNQR